MSGADFDPRTTRIRRTRTKNIEDDRLLMRRDWLTTSVKTRAHEYDTRMDWATKVAELAAIEDELDRRELITERATLNRQERGLDD